MLRLATISARLREGIILLRNAIFSARVNPGLPAVYRGMGGRKTFLAIVASSLLIFFILYHPSFDIAKKYFNLFPASAAQDFTIAILLLVLSSIIRLPIDWSFLLPLVLAVITSRFIRSELFQRDLRSTPLIASDMTEGLTSHLILLSLITATVDLLLRFFLEEPYNPATLVSHIYFFSGRYDGDRSFFIDLGVFSFEFMCQLLWIISSTANALICLFLLLLIRNKLLALLAAILWIVMEEIFSVISHDLFWRISDLPFFPGQNRLTLDDIFQPHLFFVELSRFVVALLSLLVALYCLSFFHRFIKKHWDG